MISKLEQIAIETIQIKTQRVEIYLLTKRRRKKIEKEWIQESKGTTWQFNICVIRVSEGEERGKSGQKNYLNRSGWKYSKFDENRKPTDPRNSVKPKHKKHERNYMKAQIKLLETNRKGENLWKSHRVKKTHYIEE